MNGDLESWRKLTPTSRRNRIVRVWNERNGPGGDGITLAALGELAGVPRSSVARALSEARQQGIAVVNISPEESARRNTEASLRKWADPAFREKAILARHGKQAPMEDQ